MIGESRGSAYVTMASINSLPLPASISFISSASQKGIAERDAEMSLGGTVKSAYAIFHCSASYFYSLTCV